jgi:hypothetical protein
LDHPAHACLLQHHVQSEQSAMYDWSSFSMEYSNLGFQGYWNPWPRVARLKIMDDAMEFTLCLYAKFHQNYSARGRWSAHAWNTGLYTHLVTTPFNIFALFDAVSNKETNYGIPMLITT